MESTLEVARRAVEADMAHDYATAHALYMQAATELEAFAASAGSSRTPEEVTGTCVRPSGTKGGQCAFCFRCVCV